MIITHGNLSVIQPPFSVNRSFVIYGHQEERGNHAHRTSSELLVCLQGHIWVNCDNGKTKRKVALSANEEFLLAPMIWSQQIYGRNSLLLVFCDEPYNPTEQINDYEEFLRLCAVR